MRLFEITLKNIQHIKSLNYKINLSQNKLHCIVGKNSVGKTTLFKAIKNLIVSTVLDDLSRVNIIQKDSEIIYIIDDIEYKFNPINNDDRYILDLKGAVVDKNILNTIFVELPVPNDDRFKNYHKLNEDYRSNKTGTISYKIQAEYATNPTTKPSELIELLNTTYDNIKFNNLKQIDIGKEVYYILQYDDYYLREDDFSSGEYMIVQIYKFIQKQYKMLIIDELDISLDSSAQVKLIGELQKLCTKYNTNIIFTTHSLAIMKKINELEENLYYMENDEGVVSIENRSYNFIKVELFQFVGYDKIILVEDELAEDYLKYLIKDEPKYYKYNIIPVGGHFEVKRLMDRNKITSFLNTYDVISILDGDQSDVIEYQHDDIGFLPFLSVEKRLKEFFLIDMLIEYGIKKNTVTYPLEIKHKILYKRIIDKHHMTDIDIFNLINNKQIDDIENFKNKIIEFLNR